MRIVWDEAKRLTTLDERGIDFADAEDFDWEDALYMPGHPGEDGRPRFMAIGWLHDELLTIVYSPLGTEAISIVSMRPASRKDRRLFDAR